VISAKQVEAFMRARMHVLSEASATVGIGGLSEKSLHRMLKLYIEPNENFHEVSFMGSVADVQNEHGIFEVQTGSAQRLVPKLEKFLCEASVTVVFPIILEKNILWLDKKSGEIYPPRKSPKKESIYTAFRELYKIRRLLSSEKLSVKLIFLKVDEYKYLDGRDKSGKKGATKIDRLPTAIFDETDLKSKADYDALIPLGLNGEFTAKELCRAVKCPQRLSSCFAGVLSSVGSLTVVGKRGNAFLYSIPKK
jgi:hypothetical protein